MFNCKEGATIYWAIGMGISQTPQAPFKAGTQDIGIQMSVVNYTTADASKYGWIVQDSGTAGVTVSIARDVKAGQLYILLMLTELDN